ncbi:MAG: efflux RND transporter permease subunit [Aquimonas sp.]|nr:efflux RND transporter permease subunit [Aquimonas sp.]
MIESLVRRGTLVTVAVLILCVLGVAAALRIPVQMIPDLEVRTVSVVTRWAGATPQDVEKEILIEQERFLRTVPNLRRMVSFARTGEASIELEFPFGVDINEALIRTSNALSQVSGYPENVDPPRLQASSFSNNAFMFFALAPVPGNPLAIDINMLRDFVDDEVRPRMERVPGVAQVNVGGGAERQVQIRVDPARLAQRGLGLDDVRNAVRARNRDSSGGDIDSGKRRYLIRTVGRVTDADTLQELILRRDGDSIVRLRDVAEVELSHFELRGLAFADGQPRLNLSVQREPGSNVIAIKDGLLPEVEQINRELLQPYGLELRLFSDDVRYVQDSIRNVWTNLLLGALLASAVMLYFLRSWRTTLVAMIGLPICTLAAFLGLMAAGRTINVISLAGIAFAIGMTVDNSIVVLESIESARRRGLDRLRAAIEGTREVWPAVLASTLTTALVFAPVLFIEQEAGQLFSDIGIAIATSILASMLVAIGIIPAASARFAGDTAAGSLPGDAPILSAPSAWLIARPRRALACVVATLGLTLGVVFGLAPPAEYLPEGEEPKAFTRMFAPPGQNLAEMERIAADIRTRLDPAVNGSAEAYARGVLVVPPLKYYTMSVSAGSLWVLSEPIDGGQLQAMMDQLSELFRSYPGMRAFSSRGSIISSNDGGTRAVAIELSGTELAGLYATGEALLRRAAELFDNPQLNSEPSALSLDQPLVQVLPRWERLAEVGFDAGSFGFAVAALSDGAYLDELLIDDVPVDVFLFSGAGNRQSLEALPQQPVLTPSGEVLPLSALADLVETVDGDALRRVDGRRTVTLFVIPPRSVALETAVDRVRSELLPQARAAGDVAAGVSIRLAGAADQLEATREALTGNFLIAVLLIYLLLVAIFTHWGYPGLILITVPTGIAGGILGLLALNLAGSAAGALGMGGFSQPFDMLTMLGFLILLGTVVNNPILIVDRTRANLQRGLELEAAILDAVRARLRPILMSTFSTLFGLAPLVLIPGAGTELYRGVGVVVLTGLLCSTAVTLTFLPALLRLVMGRRPMLASAVGS